MSYQFDKINHIHTFEGKPLHGVTTVLKVISKPALIQWAANVAVEYVKNNPLPLQQDGLDGVIGTSEEILEKARFAHKQKKEKAGDWGTILHEAIESWIKTGQEPQLEEEHKVVFGKFKDWVKENKVEFIESEKHVWSKDMWVGGICDLVFTMNGKKYIGDIKTSSRIYNEHFFQMAAYNLCLEEMGEHQDIEGYVVINLKKDGEIDLMRADNLEMNRQAFLAALTLHKIISSLS